MQSSGLISDLGYSDVESLMNAVDVPPVTVALPPLTSRDPPPGPPFGGLDVTQAWAVPVGVVGLGGLLLTAYWFFSKKSPKGGAEAPASAVQLRDVPVTVFGQ